MQGEVLAVVLVPHPPIMLSEIAKVEFSKVQQTAVAMGKIAKDIQALQPEALIIITPHGPVFQDAVAIYDSDTLSGDLGKFGAPQIKVSFHIDSDLSKVIIGEAGKEGIYTAMLDGQQLKQFKLSPNLDHGVVAPMSFFNELKVPVVIMAMALFPVTDLYTFGITLRRAVEQSGKKVVVIVSGDMSHKVTSDAPAGYHPDGMIFDEAIEHALAEQDFEELLTLPEDLKENAGECGYRSLVMGIGALDGYKLSTEILSYQAPFGVGYLIAKLVPLAKDPSREFLPKIKNKHQQALEKLREQESLPVKLARQTVENHTQGKSLPIGNNGEIGLEGKAGVFVSIKKNGQLRGCIGTTEPITSSVAQEIVRNAVSAAQHDPRFNSITSDELDSLVYSVDILTSATPVEDISELDAKQFGVIVESGRKRGLLLPDLEGVDTAQHQIEIALQKAGIGSAEKYELYKFQVIRYK